MKITTYEDLYNYIEANKVKDSSDDEHVFQRDLDGRNEPPNQYYETPWSVLAFPDIRDVPSTTVTHFASKFLYKSGKFYVAIRGINNDAGNEGTVGRVLCEYGWNITRGSSGVMFRECSTDSSCNVSMMKWEPRDIDLKLESKLDAMVRLLINGVTNKNLTRFASEHIYRNHPTTNADHAMRLFTIVNNRPRSIPVELGGDGSLTRDYVEIVDSIYDCNNDDIQGEYCTPHFLSRIQTCYDCETTYTNEYQQENGSMCSGRDVWCCEECVDENFAYCEVCDDRMHVDYSRYSERNEMTYCRDCWDNRERAIHSYSYEPHPLNFWSYNKKGGFTHTHNPSSKNRIDRVFYGFENEVEVRDDYDKQEIAYDIKGNEKFVYCKEDGSLNNGFEIVSHPLSFEAFNHLDWEDIFLQYRGQLRGYGPETTGMHVHMSKNAFTDNHLLKFMSMIYEYKSFTHFIAQRPLASAYNQWAKFKAGTLERVKHDMANDIKRRRRNKSGVYTSSMRWGEKYSPVNISKRNTVEVRIFKANLEEVSFRKNVEYCDALYHFTYKTPHYGLKLNTFIDHIRDESKRYPNLNKFLDDRPEQLKEVLRFPLSIPEGMEID